MTWRVGHTTIEVIEGDLTQEHTDAIGPIDVGGAAITTGGKLPAKWVIHAASMRLGGYTTAESLRASTRRSLELAAEKGLHSMAFPAVGTGIARFPMAEAARIMLDEVIRAAGQPTSLELVRFVLLGDEAERVFRGEAERRLSAKQAGEEGRRHE